MAVLLLYIFLTAVRKSKCLFAVGNVIFLWFEIPNTIGVPNQILRGAGRAVWTLQNRDEGNTWVKTAPVPKGSVSRWQLSHYSVSLPDTYQEFTIFVIQLLSKSEALYKPCATFKGRFQNPRILFTCNDGLGHQGRYVYIRDDRRDQDYFGLCEVEVFAHRGTYVCLLFQWI